MISWECQRPGATAHDHQALPWMDTSSLGRMGFETEEDKSPRAW